MDNFSLIAGMATSTFATTTGFTVEQFTAFATSSVFHVLVGIPIVFLVQNISGIIMYGSIALMLALPLSAFIFYKRSH